MSCVAFRVYVRVLRCCCLPVDVCAFVVRLTLGKCWGGEGRGGDCGCWVGLGVAWGLGFAEMDEYGMLALFEFI